MDDTNPRKKLTEARFFLKHMLDLTSTVTHEREHFDHYLSAFIGAARNVTFVMQKTDKSTYERLFPRGNFALADVDERLFGHMVDCRDETVKRTGNVDTLNKPNAIEVHRLYRDRGCTTRVFAPPGTPPAKIFKPRYYWARDGRDHDVLDDCGHYVDLLEEVLCKFERAVRLVRA